MTRFMLVVVGVLLPLTILAGDYSDEVAAPGTPAFVIQEFISALDRSDDLSAYGWLSHDVRQQFSFEEFTRDVRAAGTTRREGRIDVVREVKDDSSSVVTLDVVRIVGSDRFTNEHRIALVYEGDAWKIDEYLTYL